MQALRDDILQRTNQIISLCRNADAIADQTVITLAEQHDQLINIEAHITSIDATLIDTKDDIKCLKGRTQRMIDAFRSQFHRKILSKMLMHSRKKQDSPSISSQNQRQFFSKPIQVNISSSNSFIDEQVDEAFCEIGHLIHDLKEKAYIMNTELIGQTNILDHIHDRMIESTDHLQQQNCDVKKLISKQ